MIIVEDTKVLNNEEKIEILTEFDGELAKEMCEDMPEEIVYEEQTFDYITRPELTVVYRDND